MKLITENEMKNVQLSILDEVVAFCDKENIKYFLFAGTLLGAIRHKGYIPWDDDIDIAMNRDDYERFINIFPKDHPFLYLYRNNSEYKNCPFFFTKVCQRGTIIHEFYLDEKYIKGCGVNIDIFPIDSYISYENAIKSMKKVAFLKMIVSLKASKKSFSTIRGVIKSIISIILSPISMAYLNRVFYKIIKKENARFSKFSGNTVGAYGDKEILEKEVFEELIDVEFENKKYKGLKEYDKFLSAVYGDYMKFPPKEKQVTHHCFEGFWLNNADISIAKNS